MRFPSTMEIWEHQIVSSHWTALPAIERQNTFLILFHLSAPSSGSPPILSWAFRGSGPTNQPVSGFRGRLSLSKACVVESERQLRPSIPAPRMELHSFRGEWFAELWRYRELLYFLAWRDVKVRYKQAALGAAWAIVQPLVTMLIFSLTPKFSEP